MTGSAFPATFLWGVATAGHQNEGGDFTSDTAFVEHVTPSVFKEAAGSACDSWHRWAEDLDLAVDMHLNAYRFSVEWARVEPEPGRVDVHALDHYEAVIDGCRARGLAPIVTFNHFTAPHWFAARGGMLAEDAAERFAQYCELVVDQLGDRIALGITLNEPNLPRLLSWTVPEFVQDLNRATLEAASTAAGVPRYRTANVVQPEDFDSIEAGFERAHLAARAAIKALRPQLPVGLSVAVVDDVAEPGGEPIRDRKREEAYERWFQLARHDDFVGVQNYERMTYGPDGSLPVDPQAVVNQMGTEVEPDSLRGAVLYSFDRAQVPVLVSEHGIATADDEVRAAALAPALDGLADAAREGVALLGYCHWTHLDNFEWVSGYDTQLGLHTVDRTTMARAPKLSALEYGRLVRTARSA